MEQKKLKPLTETKLLLIGFAKEELKFFTEEKAQDTIAKFNEKLKKTGDVKQCVLN